MKLSNIQRRIFYFYSVWIEIIRMCSGLWSSQRWESCFCSTGSEDIIYSHRATFPQLYPLERIIIRRGQRCVVLATSPTRSGLKLTGIRVEWKLAWSHLSVERGDTSAVVLTPVNRLNYIITGPCISTWQHTLEFTRIYHLRTRESLGNPRSPVKWNFNFKNIMF